MQQECKVPPEDWYCTRESGHEGPCAAIPEITINLEKCKIRWRKYWWQFWRPKPRKLKAKWTIEEQQPESYYDSCEDGDCGECLACSRTKMITEEIVAEIKREFQISN